MAATLFPTKGNLINTKKSLSLALMGYELMDRKRNILVREMMSLISQANALQDEIDGSYDRAYEALQNANVTMGFCDAIAASVPIETDLKMDYRSVMGVELPIVRLAEHKPDIHYGFYYTDSHLDEAYMLFDKVKRLTAVLAEVENSVYRLAYAVKKTQKRANALHNIIIPRFQGNIKYIAEALEEKDREEFSRLKVIKKRSDG